HREHRRRWITPLAAFFFFFFQAEDGIRDLIVTGVQTCALPIWGRVTGAVYFDENKREHFQPARAVVLCANGAETPRLLLMSASSRFPHGLANSSGLVGKYLMLSGYGCAHGVFERPVDDFRSVVR